MAEAAVEATVVATEMVPLDAAATNATSVTNLGTLRASARRIKIFATAATESGILRKTANRLL